MFMRKTKPARGPAQPWSAQQLLALLVAVIAAALVAAVGLGYLIVSSLHGSSSGSEAAATYEVKAKPIAQMFSTTAQGQSRRDAVAASTMPSFPDSASAPTSPAQTPNTTIHIPASTSIGPQNVPTGFPHTPQGADAQLGALLSTVWSQMSIQTTTSVYNAWSLPGGIGASQWQPFIVMMSFLDSVGQGSGTMPPGVSASAIPAAAITKGTDGPDWTLSCVLMTFTASGGSKTESAGIGDCERMQWVNDPTIAGVGGRWEIAPGVTPAAAPNTWPGSPASQQAGWQTWQQPGSVGN